jgi:hypothetical protein
MATFTSTSTAANVTLAGIRWRWLVSLGFSHENLTQRWGRIITLCLQMIICSRAVFSIPIARTIILGQPTHVGHGAKPYTTVDPVAMAARAVVGLQTIVARETDPFSPVVVTVESIHGGSAASNTLRNLSSSADAM